MTRVSPSVRFLVVALALAGWVAAASSTATRAQTAQPPVSLAPPDDISPAKEQADLGIPVTSDLVRKRCQGCHPSDDKNRLSRISYRRTTPEGWQLTIRRMAALNGVKLDPKEAREILAYLSNNLGLAPEEAKPGAFELERRMVDYEYKADKDTEQTCIKCHSFGRVLLQRRTENEWKLLINMHRGYYPFVDFQAFRRMEPLRREPGPDGRPPDNRHPQDKAIAHLSKAFPLQTPEWASWSATMRPPKLDGRWVVEGRQTGKGPVYGTVTITPGAEPGSYATEARLTFVHTGEAVVRKGTAVVYTGYQWRGRSTRDGATGQDMREVMFVERDWRTMSGRWFSGAYDEFGVDVSLSRIGNDPVLTGVWPLMMKRGATGQELRLYGANLPARLTASDLNLGAPLKVSRVVSATPTLVTVQVDVPADAVVGARDVYLVNGAGRARLTVFDKIDSIRVAPSWAMARLGGSGSAFEKGYAQFEALAYANGIDGKANTDDDVELGPVDVKWSLEEFTATYQDEDIKYVGTIDPESGLFTPNIDGPNPQRVGNRNNYGDVWVVATLGQPGSERPLRARAHLLVTVPIYMNWDQDVTR